MSGAPARPDAAPHGPVVAAAPGPRPLAALLAIGAGAAYFVALHVVLTDARRPRLALAIALAPWAFAVVAGAARRSRGRLAIALVATATAWWALDRWLASHVAAMLLVENVAFYLVAAGSFAVTLRPGREPLVTRFARIQRGGDLPARARDYTRGATLAWALFFVAVAVVSTALYLAASLAAWSLFVNILVWPSIVAMFAGEYVVRRLALPELHHGSPFAGAGAWLARRRVPADAAWTPEER